MVAAVLQAFTLQQLVKRQLLSTAAHMESSGQLSFQTLLQKNIFDIWPKGMDREGPLLDLYLLGEFLKLKFTCTLSAQLPGSSGSSSTARAAAQQTVGPFPVHVSAPSRRCHVMITYQPAVGCQYQLLGCSASDAAGPAQQATSSSDAVGAAAARQSAPAQHPAASANSAGVSRRFVAAAGAPHGAGVGESAGAAALNEGCGSEGAGAAKRMRL